MHDSPENYVNKRSSAHSPDEGRSRKSDIACYSCRRRKVRCDRRYPHCSVCKETAEICSYPQGPLKPGPKLGSTKRTRKRPYRNDMQLKQKRLSDVLNSPSQDASASAGCEPHFQERGATAIPCSCHRSLTQEHSSPGPQGVVFDGVNNLDGHGQSKVDSRNSQYYMHELSFILHPAHDPPSPDQAHQTNTARYIEQESSRLQKLCGTLGVSREVLGLMVNVYFDNMVSINLFREPYFHQKLSEAVPMSETYALFAAMLAFAARFCSSRVNAGWNPGLADVKDIHLQSQDFLTLAFTHIDNALEEYGDEPPSLGVLQALIIATHCQLTQGVRGKAWRSLGKCIRLAYELNLHLIDSDEVGDIADVDARRWCCAEEKRRAWWATWEMDVFASTIRRTPPAIDWSQMETLLPVEDQYWFEGRPQLSCFMDLDPTCRWKRLHECGNQSPKAWFLVVNSFMKEAQRVSAPRSLPFRGLRHNHSHRRPNADQQFSRQTGSYGEGAAQRLDTLANSVRCLVMVLPEHLRYHNQFLDFHARLPGQSSSSRQLHCSIYNMYVMTQLARLMIYRSGAFRSLNSKSWREKGSSNPEKDTPDRNSASTADNLALAQYFEAADNILTIITRSCDSHIQYINPFLSSTIWLASAVQILHKEVERDEASRTLIRSKFDVLHMTYLRCVSFWNIHTALQQNLEALETELGNNNCFNHAKQGQSLNTDPHTGESSQMQPTTGVSIDTNQTIFGPKFSNVENIANAAIIPDEYQHLPSLPETALSTLAGGVEMNDSECNYLQRSEIPTPAAIPYTLPTTDQASPSRLAYLSIFDYMDLPYFDGQDPAFDTYSTRQQTDY